MKQNKKIRNMVFWPAFTLLLIALIISLIDQDSFYNLTNYMNSWVLKNLGWIYSLTSFLCLIAIIVAYFSPLGEVIVGGVNAKPIITKKNWITITLCTSMAAGALFWGMAEPIYHMSSPPIGIEPNSWQSAKFAMETMVLHWSIHPYSIYTLPVIAFSFAFFNMKKPFSVASQLSVITDKFNISLSEKGKFSQIIDTILIFSMGLGILGVLCTGTINMGGAIKALTNIESSKTWIFILFIITIIYIFSSISGIQKGIKTLSNINIFVYILILSILFIFGSSSFMIDGIIESVGATISNLPERLLTTGVYSKDPWAKNWTVFYAGSWGSWAPISACFLSRLCVGYKIKDLIKINFGIPILFNIIWVGIFSNIAVNFQLTGKLDLISILETQGPESVIYAVLKELPGANIIILIFFFALIFSMITAMDSTTNSIASLSTSGISLENQEAPIYLKIIWGFIFAILSYIILTISGIDGIKMVSNLGGLPNIFIILGSVFCVFIISSNVKKYDYVDFK